MATRAIIKMSAIQQYFGEFFNNSLKRAENALESGHLKSFTYDPDHKQVFGSVLASKKNCCYEITVSV